MDKTEFERKQKELFTKLLSAKWNKRGATDEFKEMQIWQHIQSNELTAAPAFKGDKYDNSKYRIMFVGRALNGWEAELGDCSSLEETVDAVINQDNKQENYTGLWSIVNKNGYKSEGSKRIYYHKYSKYFRFIKHILEKLKESDDNIDETFYNDEKKWNQKFVWANLYCISPRDGGNPSNTLIYPGNETYIELIKLYIEYYTPQNVVFITDLDGWFKIWEDKSFYDLFNSSSDYEVITDSDTIVLKGKISDTNVIVCKRPDRRGISYEQVAKMAEKVAEYIKENGKIT